MNVMGLTDRQGMARDRKGVGLYRKPRSIRDCGAVGGGGGQNTRRMRTRRRRRTRRTRTR